MGVGRVPMYIGICPCFRHLHGQGSGPRPCRSTSDVPHGQAQMVGRPYATVLRAVPWLSTILLHGACPCHPPPKPPKGAYACSPGWSAAQPGVNMTRATSNSGGVTETNLPRPSGARFRSYVPIPRATSPWLRAYAPLGAGISPRRLLPEPALTAGAAPRCSVRRSRSYFRHVI